MFATYLGVSSLVAHLQNSRYERLGELQKFFLCGGTEYKYGDHFHNVSDLLQNYHHLGSTSSKNRPKKCIDRTLRPQVAKWVIGFKIFRTGPKPRRKSQKGCFTSPYRRNFRAKAKGRETICTFETFDGLRSSHAVISIGCVLKMITSIQHHKMKGSGVITGSRKTHVTSRRGKFDEFASRREILGNSCSLAPCLPTGRLTCITLQSHEDHGPCGSSQSRKKGKPKTENVHRCPILKPVCAII
jgi:hypothetical protein